MLHGLQLANHLLTSRFETEHAVRVSLEADLAQEVARTNRLQCVLQDRDGQLRQASSRHSDLELQVQHDPSEMLVLSPLERSPITKTCRSYCACVRSMHVPPNIWPRPVPSSRTCVRKQCKTGRMLTNAIYVRLITPRSQRSISAPSPRRCCVIPSSAWTASRTWRISGGSGGGLC